MKVSALVLSGIVVVASSLTLSTCKKEDCSGQYTFKGKIWNGSTNKPRAFVPLKVSFSESSNAGIFSSGSGYKVLGNTTTDANGNFSFTYPCQNTNGYIGIDAAYGYLPYDFVGSDNANKNVDKEFNVPDSVTLDLYIMKQNGLGASDTLYLYIGVPESGGKPYFTYPNQPNGLYKRYRIEYAKAIEFSYTIGITLGIGYNAFKQALLHPPNDFKNNISKLEPEINSYYVYY